MNGLRRLREDAPPLAPLACYIGLQGAAFAAVALLGADEVGPAAGMLGVLLVLVYLIARRSHLAWSLALAWEVFGLAVLLLAPFVGATSAGERALVLLLVGVQAASLWLLWSPTLRVHVRDRDPVRA